MTDLISTILLTTLILMALGCNRPPEGMVLVSAGEFIMGSDRVDTEGQAAEFGSMKPWFVDEHPQGRFIYRSIMSTSMK